MTADGRAGLPADHACAGGLAEPVGATPAPSLPLPTIASLRVLELGTAHEVLLQRFFDANPAYFLAVNGEPAGPGEAQSVIVDRPPPGWTYTRKWLLGWLDADGAVVAMADLATDLQAPGVWHIGLFIVATARHGSGDAQALHRSLAHWACASGATWLRLGVVQGNARAERFWAACGYRQLRTREGLAMGRCVHTVRVMCKPLAGGGLADYLALVAQDRPNPMPSSGVGGARR